VRKIYVELLVKRGDITMEEAEQALEDYSNRLQRALEETRSLVPAHPVRAVRAGRARGVLPHIVTGVEREVLDRVFAAMNATPEGFEVHPRLARQHVARAKLYEEEGMLEWATAEALAFGSLLLEGTDIRFSGQDSRRGTFSQRHAVLVDHRDGTEHAPLAHLDGEQGKFWIYDSLLSEYAVVGFEYGYSVVNKDALVCWEAQFGDFMNGAQIIIDQFLASAEDKWGQTSGLVMLLPHGYDGQGPEHSSARIERFLTLAAEDNIQVVNATTAAQYFHLLRRQVRREVRKPLIVATPKYLLRAKEARSSVADLTTGSFEELLDDPTTTDPASVQRIVLCSGKVAYDVMRRRDETAAPVAVVRVEQLYPLPEEQIADIFARYGNASSVCWVQEEPENMGPWPFVHNRLHKLAPGNLKLTHASRGESGSPATGSAAVHAQELEDLLDTAFAGL
jgi:2-oxoglutarate dehydrogenase E1 component